MGVDDQILYSIGEGEFDDRNNSKWITNRLCISE